MSAQAWPGGSPAAADDADAMALLSTDHQQTQELFQAYARMVAQAAPDATRQRLAELICLTVAVHDRLETQLFYPLARESLANPAPIDKAFDDHVAIGRLVRQIQGTSAAQRGYDQRIARLERLLQDHVRFEDEAILAPLRRQGMRFGDLGVVLAQWREHLLSRKPRP